MPARTHAGRRLLQMLSTDPGPRGGHRIPTAFDARLVERIAEAFVPDIEDEASDTPGTFVEMGQRVFLRWADGPSWGIVRAISGDGQGYTIIVEREGPDVRTQD